MCLVSGVAKSAMALLFVSMFFGCSSRDVIVDPQPKPYQSVHWPSTLPHILSGMNPDDVAALLQRHESHVRILCAVAEDVFRGHSVKIQSYMIEFVDRYIDGILQEALNNKDAARHSEIRDDSAELSYFVALLYQRTKRNSLCMKQLGIVENSFLPELASARIQPLNGDPVLLGDAVEYLVDVCSQD